MKMKKMNSYVYEQMNFLIDYLCFILYFLPLPFICEDSLWLIEASILFIYLIFIDSIFQAFLSITSSLLHAYNINDQFILHVYNLFSLSLLHKIISTLLMFMEMFELKLRLIVILICREVVHLFFLFLKLWSVLVLMLD